MVRVLIVNNHPLVRTALIEVLARGPGIEVVGHASNATEAIDAAVRLHPDVVLMDLSMPEGSGLDACRAIKGATDDVRVLFLASFDDTRQHAEALCAGAAGLILKDLDPARLRQSILGS
jgi:two-component system response regulator DevR